MQDLSHAGLEELGLKQMVLAMFGLPDNAGLVDWTQAAGQLNKIGEQTRKAWIQMVFHNHEFEFRQIGGVLVYDHLMGVRRPALSICTQ